MKTTRYFDPPGGWRYGFPKAYNPLPNENFMQWLIREGYPPDEVEWAMRHMRAWEETR